MRHKGLQNVVDFLLTISYNLIPSTLDYWGILKALVPGTGAQPRFLTKSTRPILHGIFSDFLPRIKHLDTLSTVTQFDTVSLNIPHLHTKCLLTNCRPVPVLYTACYRFSTLKFIQKIILSFILGGLHA